MIRRGRIPTGPNGEIDPLAADGAIEAQRRRAAEISRGSTVARLPGQVEGFIRANGYPPSTGDLAAYLGISRGAAAGRIDIAHRRGLIRFEKIQIAESWEDKYRAIPTGYNYELSDPAEF